MAYPTNFEFNGVNLNSIGYTIVSFDGVTTGEQDYGDALSYNISKAANNIFFTLFINIVTFQIHPPMHTILNKIII